MNRTIVFDLDGVVYLGERQIPGAGSTLTALVERGNRVLFCTNNSAQTPAQSAEKIRSVTGFDASSESIVTSAMAAGTLIEDEQGPVFVIGEDGVVAAVEGAGLRITQDHTEATVVVAGIDRHLTYRRLAQASLAVQRGARFVGTNADASFPRPDGLYPGAGSILAALSVATGVDPEVAGKPNMAMRRLISSRSEGEVWMVGDRPDTDLAMAVAEGWTSVLVLTGVVTRPEHSTIRPDHVIASIADLGGVVPS